MFKLHLYNLFERKLPDVKKIIDIFEKTGIHLEFNKPTYVIEIINSNKIFAYINFNETINIYDDKIKKLGFSLLEIEELENSFKYINDFKITNNEIREKKPSLYLNKDGVRFVFQVFSNNEFEKEFYNFFSLDLPIIIKNKEDEKFEIFGDKKNFFIKKQFNFLLENLSIPYGLAINLFKHKFKQIEAFYNISTKDKITLKDINIQNNQNSLFTEKNTVWHSNRKLHILNLANLASLDFEKIIFYKNSNNQNYYFSINGDYYKIKIFFKLTGNNLLKSYEKYTKSTELSFIIDNYKNNRTLYLIRCTKSKSKTLLKSLDIVSFEKIEREYLYYIEKDLSTSTSNKED